MLITCEKKEGNYEFKFVKADTQMYAVIGKTTYDRHMKLMENILDFQLETMDFEDHDKQKKEVIKVYCLALYTNEMSIWNQSEIQSNIEFIATGLFNVPEIKAIIENEKYSKDYFWNNLAKVLEEYLYAPMNDNKPLSHYLKKALSNHIEQISNVQVIPVDKNKKEEKEEEKQEENAITVDIEADQITEVISENKYKSIIPINNLNQKEEIKQQFEENNLYNVGVNITAEQINDIIYNKIGIKLDLFSEKIKSFLDKITLTKDQVFLLLANLIRNKDIIKTNTVDTLNQILNVIDCPCRLDIIKNIENSIDTLYDSSFTFDQRLCEIEAWYDSFMNIPIEDILDMTSNFIKEYDRIKNILLISIFNMSNIILDFLPEETRVEINKNIIDLINDSSFSPEYIATNIINEIEKNEKNVDTSKIKNALKDKNCNHVNHEKVHIEASVNTINAQNASIINPYFNNVPQQFWNYPGVPLYDNGNNRDYDNDDGYVRDNEENKTNNIFNISHKQESKENIEENKNSENIEENKNSENQEVTETTTENQQQFKENKNSKKQQEAQIAIDSEKNNHGIIKNMKRIIGNKNQNSIAK